MSAEKKNNESDPTEKLKELKLVEEGNEEKEEEKEEENGEVNKEESSSASPEPSDTVYPGISGENSVYVKLVSSDDHEYYIRRELAETSKTIRDMLRCPSGNIENNTVYFRMIDSRILQKVCHYLTYRKHYLEKKGEVEPFVIKPEDALDLMLVSGFFQI